MTLRFQNTLTGRKEDFVPLEAGRVRLYTCGPTVHARAHVGNFRTFLFEDVLRRVLRRAGYAVTQVMNITDVDDKIIQKAKTAGVPIGAYTAEYTRLFFEDAHALGIEPAEHYPRATDYVPEMVRLIRRLGERGHTYERDGSVYFRIATFPPYGRLSGVDLAGIRDGARVDADEYDKEDPKDFVLWKAAKPGDVVWETELGPGRPGWHIECSAMAMALLGESFDIHTGGVDNIFPHHENEIAQSEAATGKPFARTWLHAQHLVLGDRKMAKSLGNIVTLGDLLERGYDPLAVRYLLIAAHYRTPLQLTEESLGQATAARQRLRDLALRLAEAAGKGAATLVVGGGEPGDEAGETDGSGRGPREKGQRERSLSAPPGGEASREATPPGLSPVAQAVLDQARRDFDGGLADDLNVPMALAAVFEFVREANSLLDKTLSEEAAAVFLEELLDFDKILGVIGPLEITVPDEIVSLVRLREEARARREFSRSDEIRQALLARGWAVEDTPAGPRVKTVPPS